MLIDELMRRGIEVITFDAQKRQYDVNFRRPEICRCCNQGRASKIGRTAYRKVLDVDKEQTGVLDIYLSVQRFRCSKCKEYIHSEDEGVLESLLPKKGIWTNAAIVFIIRQLLIHPEYKYAYFEKKYGASQGSLCEAFREFRENVQKDLSPMLKCEKAIIWPIQSKDGSDVCIFGVQDGRIGLLEIGNRDYILPFLEWIISKPFLQQVVCSIELANAINLTDIYPKYALPQKQMAEFKQRIMTSVGNDLWTQLLAIDVHSEDYQERVNLLYDAICAADAVDRLLLECDVGEYIDTLRYQVEYDEEYVEAVVEKISALRARQFDDADILMRLIFTSSLHRDMLLKTKYAEYVID